MNEVLESDSLLLQQTNKQTNKQTKKVTHLVIRKPPKFRFKPGDYVFLNIPTISKHEWHPFSISSAPERSDFIWLHIKAAGNWTKTLYTFSKSSKFDTSQTSNFSVMSFTQRRMTMRAHMSKIINDSYNFVPAGVRKLSLRLNDRKIDFLADGQQAVANDQAAASMCVSASKSSNSVHLLGSSRKMVNFADELPDTTPITAATDDENKRNSQYNSGNNNNNNKMRLESPPPLPAQAELEPTPMQHHLSAPVPAHHLLQALTAANPTTTTTTNSDTTPFFFTPTTSNPRHSSASVTPMVVMATATVPPLASQMPSKTNLDRLVSQSCLIATARVGSGGQQVSPSPVQPPPTTVTRVNSLQHFSAIIDCKPPQRQQTTARVTATATDCMQVPASDAATTDVANMSNVAAHEQDDEAVDHDHGGSGEDRMNAESTHLGSAESRRAGGESDLSYHHNHSSHHVSLSQEAAHLIESAKRASIVINLHPEEQEEDEDEGQYQDDSDDVTVAFKPNSKPTTIESTNNKQSAATTEVATAATKTSKAAATAAANDALGYLKLYQRPNRVNIETIDEDRVWRLKCFIDGPYGTPSQQIFDAEHAVLIASGIGITPFASILQSMMFRYRQARATCPGCDYKLSDQFVSDEERLNVRKVDFIWITREQRSLEWFISMLSQMEMEQMKQRMSELFLETHLYVTSAKRQSDLRSINLHMTLDAIYSKEESSLLDGLRQRTHHGRPNWDVVLQALMRKQRGKINVFYCGLDSLGHVLQKKCAEYGLTFKKEIF